MKTLALLALLFSALTVQAQQGDKREVQPDPIPKDTIPPAPFLSPEKALQSFQLPEGFSINTFAAEPMVKRPVMIQFDTSNRCWVVEMQDYMTDFDGSEEGQNNSRILLLEDTDHDGKADKETVVIEKLNNPRLATPCHGGLLYALLY